MLQRQEAYLLHFRKKDKKYDNNVKSIHEHLKQIIIEEKTEFIYNERVMSIFIETGKIQKVMKEGNNRDATTPDFYIRMLRPSVSSLIKEACCR